MDSLESLRQKVLLTKKKKNDDDKEDGEIDDILNSPAQAMVNQKQPQLPPQQLRYSSSFQTMQQQQQHNPFQNVMNHLNNSNNQNMSNMNMFMHDNDKGPVDMDLTNEADDNMLRHHHQQHLQMQSIYQQQPPPPPPPPPFFNQGYPPPPPPPPQPPNLLMFKPPPSHPFISQQPLSFQNNNNNNNNNNISGNLQSSNNYMLDSNSPTKQQQQHSPPHINGSSSFVNGMSNINVQAPAPSQAMLENAQLHQMVQQQQYQLNVIHQQLQQQLQLQQNLYQQQQQAAALKRDKKEKKREKLLLLQQSSNLSPLPLLASPLVSTPPHSSTPPIQIPPQSSITTTTTTTNSAALSNQRKNGSNLKKSKQVKTSVISTNNIQTSRVPSMIIHVDDETDSEVDETTYAEDESSSGEVEFATDDIVDQLTIAKKKELNTTATATTSGMEELKRKIAEKEEALLRKKLEERLKAAKSSSSSTASTVTGTPSMSATASEPSQIAVASANNTTTTSSSNNTVGSTNLSSSEDIEMVASYDDQANSITASNIVNEAATLLTSTESVSEEKNSLKKMATDLVETNRLMVKSETEIFKLELELASVMCHRKEMELKINSLKAQLSAYQSELDTTEQQADGIHNNLDSLRSTSTLLLKSYNNKVKAINTKKRKFDESRESFSVDPFLLSVIDLASNSVILTPDNQKIIEEISTAPQLPRHVPSITIKNAKLKSSHEPSTETTTGIVLPTASTSRAIVPISTTSISTLNDVHPRKPTSTPSTVNESDQEDSGIDTLFKPIQDDPNVRTKRVISVVVNPPPKKTNNIIDVILQGKTLDQYLDSILEDPGKMIDPQGIKIQTIDWADNGALIELLKPVLKNVFHGVRPEKMETVLNNVSTTVATGAPVVSWSSSSSNALGSSSSSTKKTIVKGKYYSPLMFFRSFRFSNTYTKLCRFSLTSPMYSIKLNLWKKLCMYELDGVCRDPQCKFQHTRDYTMSNREIIEDILTYSNDQSAAIKEDCMRILEESFPSSLKKAFTKVISENRQLILNICPARLEVLEHREKLFREMKTKHKKKKKEVVIYQPMNRITQSRTLVSSTVVEKPETEDFLNIDKYVEIVKREKPPTIQQQQSTQNNKDESDEESSVKKTKESITSPTTTTSTTTTASSNSKSGDEKEEAETVYNETEDRVEELVQQYTGDDNDEIRTRYGVSTVSSAEYLANPTNLLHCFGYLCSSSVVDVLTNTEKQQEILDKLYDIVNHNPNSEIFWKIYIEVYSRKFSNSSTEIEELINAASRTCSSIVLTLMKLRLPNTLNQKLAITTQTLQQLFNKMGPFTSLSNKDVSFWTLELILTYLRVLLEAGWRDTLIKDFLLYYIIDSKYASIFIPHFGQHAQRESFLFKNRISIDFNFLPVERNFLKLVFFSLLVFNEIPETTQLYENKTTYTITPKNFILNWQAFFDSKAFLKNEGTPYDISGALNSLFSDLGTDDTQEYTLNHLYFHSFIVQPKKFNEIIQNVLLQFPHLTQVWLLLARKNNEVEILKKAVEYNPKSFELLKEYIVCLLHNNNVTDAISIIDKHIYQLFLIDEKQVNVIKDEKIQTISLFNIILGKNDVGISFRAQTMKYMEIGEDQYVHFWIIYILYIYCKKNYVDLIPSMKKALSSLSSISDQKLIWKELLYLSFNYLNTPDIDSLIDQFYQEIPTDFNYPISKYLELIPHETPNIFKNALKPPVLKDYTLHNQVLDEYIVLKNYSLPLLKKYVWMFPDNSHFFSMYIKQISESKNFDNIKSILTTITPKRDISLSIWKLSLKAAIEFNQSNQQISKLYKNILSYYPYNYDVWMNRIIFEKKSNPTNYQPIVSTSIEKALQYGVNIWMANNNTNINN